jgi:hypothetical protein
MELAWKEAGEVPNLWSLLATLPTSFNASANVYGLSLFALRRGLKSRSRNERRVWVPPISRMEEMVTGSVELMPICCF